MNVRALFDLSGRVAFVTGGGRGLGRHIALGLAEAGADVVVASRKLENCQAAVAEIERLGRRGWAFGLDLADEAQVGSVSEAALEATGRIDVLVNNASFTWGAPMFEFPTKGWDRVFDVNVRGHWQLSQRLARAMADGEGGSITFLSSIAAMRGASDEKEPAIAYTAAKGALISLTRDMAIKLAPHGIRVNCVSPGAFDTEMLDYVRSSEDRLRAFLDQIPMKRPGGADDIKGVIVFLASAAAAYVTGQNLVVDGGWLVDA